MGFDCDVAIVGAGASGLSLAARLAGGPLRVVLVDRREGFGHDRTFSGFRTRPHPFSGAVERAYRYVVVEDERRRIVRSTAEHPYETIPGDVFYETALRLASRGGNVELALGRDVGRVDGDVAAGWVETEGGVIRARLVLDARGALRARPGLGDPSFVQRFLGRVVRTERPIFTPDHATLMDFRTSQERGPHFVYVLPTSPREALVEDTYFTTGAVDEAEHRAAIEAWLGRAGAGAVETLREERGALPMTTALPSPHPSPRVRRIGIAGGAAKPSTGYAFAFIQREADAIASALATAPDPGRAVFPPVRSSSTRFLDAVFLSWLERSPARGASAFVELFAHAPIGAVARFLTEAAGPLDHARVMAAMPRAELLAVARQRAGI